MPFREAASPESLPCPRCAAGLRRRALADATAYECRACRGVFVEAALLPRITDALDLGGEILTEWPPGRRSEPVGGRMYLPCPRCGEMMARHLFAEGVKVVVDTCAPHGTWFDESELRAVAEAAAGGELERERERGRGRGPARQPAAANTTAGSDRELARWSTSSTPDTEDERFWLLELVASFFSRP